jgi:hypothetical protein
MYGKRMLTRVFIVVHGKLYINFFSGT